VYAINIAAHVQLLITPTPEHKCFMFNVIVEGYELSDGLRYQCMIGDSDSSVHHAVCHGVSSYGRHIFKLECANHAVKCFRGHLVKLAHSLKENMDLLATNCQGNEMCNKKITVEQMKYPN